MMQQQGSHFDESNDGEARPPFDWNEDRPDFDGAMSNDGPSSAWWDDNGFRYWDRDFIEHERDAESLRVIINRLYLEGANADAADYSGYVSGSLDVLVQDAATVIGIDAQVVYNELASNRSLVEIGIHRGIGEMALREGLIELNPDLAPYASSLVHNNQLLTSTVYIPS